MNTVCKNIVPRGEPASKKQLRNHEGGVETKHVYLRTLGKSRFLEAIARISIAAERQHSEQAKEEFLGYLSSIDSLDHMVKAPLPEGNLIKQVCKNETSPESGSAKEFSYNANGTISSWVETSSGGSGSRFTHKKDGTYTDDGYQNGNSSSKDSSSSPLITTGKENALEAAKRYLGTMPFSEKRLKEQLEYEGFTQSQAEYGVSQAGY